MQRRDLNGPLLWSLAFLSIAALVLVMNVPTVLTALFEPGTDDVQVAAALEHLVEEHEKALTVDTERFIGRSIFFKPKQPPPKREPIVIKEPVPREPVEIKRPVDTGPKPKPPYSGPAIMALLGDEVWFKNKDRIKIGQEKNGLTVVSVEAPYGATVDYRGHEYELDFFEKDFSGLFATVKAEPKTAPMPNFITEVKDPTGDDDDAPKAEIETDGEADAPVDAEADAEDGIDPEASPDDDPELNPPPTRPGRGRDE